MPRGSSSTGGNTEPMPFVRSFGVKKEEEDAIETFQPPPPINFNGQQVVKNEVPFDYNYAAEKFANGDNGHGTPEKSPRKRSRSPRKRDRSPSESHSRSKRSRSRKRSKERKRSRSHEKKKKRKRSRSRDKHRRESSRDRKRRSRSRSRSRSRDRKRHRRESRSRSHSRPKEETHSPATNPQEQKPPVIPIDAASKLPPTIRGAVIAQSLLAKPEALPAVIEKAASALGIEGGVTEASKRVRKSRWSTTKSFVPGMPTILPSDLDDNQRQGYLLQLEIEEATRKLRMGDFAGPADPAERSPSPEPVYDSNGKRLNTRDVRKRQELEQLRHEKIQQLLKINPNYKPPADYRAPNIRLHDKVWIPQEDHPEINFVGLLIGPRGNTLKSLEMETGAKIIIRGKGSVKEGKFGRRDGPLPGENEPLHAYISGNDSAVIKRACERIREIINAALMIPDGQNELRKLQLRELAVLNGTLRPEDILGGTRCSNCGSDQHKSWECPDAPNVTASIVCTACGGAGHIARDCKNPRPGFQYDGGAGMDDEYSALMAELGVTPEPGTYDPGMAAAMGGVPKFSLQRQQQQQERKFTLPSGAPIVRVNLAKQQPTAADYWASGDLAGYYSETYGDASQAAAGASWPPPASGIPNNWTPGYPNPVPPPPQPGSYGSFPPPPPPPPSAGGGADTATVAADEWNFGALLAPPAPPPPPS